MTDAAQTGRLRGGSIRVRLPILMAVLLAASIGAFGWMAYREVERAFLYSARNRVEAVGRQLAALFAQTSQPRLDEVRRLAAHPAIRTLVTTRSATAAAAARGPILELLKSNPQNLGIDVWSKDGTRLLSVVAPGSDGGLTSEAPMPTAIGFSPLRSSAGAIGYDITAVVSENPVTQPGAASLGVLSLHRHSSPAGAAVIVKQLVGGDVTVEFGTRDVGVWTNLSTVTPAPPAAALANRGAVAYRTARGDERFGALATIVGTPWLAWVSTSREEAIAPVRSFLRRMLGLSLGIIVVGAGIGWMAARRITGPLVALTKVTEAIAAGHLSRRVPAGERDEVGRLGTSFNKMAERVEDGYRQLDARVQERTETLRATLRELEEAQETLVRREKLAMLGQLASGVGHELRNPLGVMTNAVYYLDLVQPEAPPEVREYHGILRTQIGLAERIVGDLLDFARIKPPQRQEVSLAQLVEEQVGRVGSMPGVTIESDVDPSLPGADIDPVQIGQVLLNLLVNGAQAMEQGGVVTVRGRRAGNDVALDVIDTGPGVPPELREKIFEALFTTRARGIGLGLAVSRSLVAANGGTLAVTDAPGGGAMFTLTLPAVPVAAAQESV